jgi:hypothetical protein
MYRRYGISSYKNLPQRHFAEVLGWLRGWHAEIEGFSKASQTGDEQATSGDAAAKGAANAYGN